MTSRLGLLALFLTGCNGCVVGEPLPPSVIVIVMDGVRTDEFTSAFTSDLTGVTGEAFADRTWAEVVPDGVVMRAAINSGVTITGPAHAAMLTGRPEVLANFPVDATRGPGVYRPEVPTIFEEARAQLGLGEDSVVMLANTVLLEGMAASTYPGFGAGARYDFIVDEGTEDTPARDDEPVLAALDELIATTPPRLAVLNLHNVDRDGHYGDLEDYVDGVDAIDEALAAWWSRLQEQHPDYAENLLVVVTADHGRHRHDDDDGFRNHGDMCTGCREVPLLVLGGKVGEERDDRVVSLDLAPTIAAHLGIDLPFAEGLPWVEAFDALDGRARTGEVGVVESGGRVASQVWVDSRDARSEVHVDGAIVSTPGAFAAEAPALIATDDGARVCFRELTLVAVDGFAPWAPRCLAEVDRAWEDIGFPDPDVSPYFRAAFAERAGLTWVAWPRNPDGIGELGVDGGNGLLLASWDAEAGWSEPLWVRAIFPTDTAIVPTAHGVLAAVGTSLGDPEYRYSRRVRLVTVDLTGDAPAVSAETDLSLGAFLEDDARVEHPALTADGNDVSVAMIGTGTAGSVVAAASSTDGGRTWGDPVLLPDGGDVIPGVTPAWDAGEVIWAVVVDDAASLCRAAPGASDATCVEVGSARVASITVDGGVVTAVIDTGIGAWEPVTVGW